MVLAVVGATLTGVTVRGIDAAWLRERVRESTAPPAAAGDEVDRRRELLLSCATGFPRRRPDVASSQIVCPRRGLGTDEARGFVRAVEHGIAVDDDAGYVTLPTIRPKTPTGRFALLGKSGEGVSVNLEYLIQIGATAETDPRPRLGSGRDRLRTGRVRRAGPRRGRARGAGDGGQGPVTGPDSLRSWSRRGGTLGLPARSPERAVVLEEHQEERVLETHPYDPSRHRPGTGAHDGSCSWHGPVSCPEPPVISFQDRGVT